MDGTLVKTTVNPRFVYSNAMKKCAYCTKFPLSFTLFLWFILLKGVNSKEKVP